MTKRRTPSPIDEALKEFFSKSEWIELRRSMEALREAVIEAFTPPPDKQ